VIQIDNNTSGIQAHNAMPKAFAISKKSFATKMQGHGNLQLTQVGGLWSFKSTKLI